MKDLLRKIFGPRGKKITAGELAKKFGLELKGKASEVVSGVAPIADAKPVQLAFYSTERNSNAFKILPIVVMLGADFVLHFRISVRLLLSIPVASANSLIVPLALITCSSAL